tara:strand:- start:131 stop:325 length:195 start_codon:yes stop_codon:yes gene_type:complete
MQNIHKYDHPVDLETASMFGQYGVNLYKGDKFVEGRVYVMYSGNMMMEEIRFLKRDGICDRVEW